MSCLESQVAVKLPLSRTVGSFQGHSACNLRYWSQVQPSSAISSLLGITICLKPKEHLGIYLCLQSDVFLQVEELQALVSSCITWHCIAQNCHDHHSSTEEIFVLCQCWYFPFKTTGSFNGFSGFFSKARIQQWPIVLKQLGGFELSPHWQY